MARKTKIFCDNIIFKNCFADNNTKVLGNQNLQLMYNFNFNNYLDAYLYSYNLEKQFFKIPTHQLYELLHPKQQNGAPKG